MFVQYGYGGGGFNLYDMVAQWQQLGFYDVLLPFLLIFTISFAVLQKVKIFGESKGVKNINLVISLIIGLLFLQNQYLIFILQRFLPNVSIVIVWALMFLLVLGLFSGEQKGWSGGALKVAFTFSLLITLIALSIDFIPGAFAGDTLSWFYDNQGWILMLIAVIIVFTAVASDDGNKNKGVDFFEGLRGGKKD
jgi:hypothetical protein